MKPEPKAWMAVGEQARGERYAELEAGLLPREQCRGRLRLRWALFLSRHDWLGFLLVRLRRLL